MSTERNKALVREMVEEVFNRGNIDRADEFIAADFVEREELPPGVPGGREGVKQGTVMMRAAFPDLRATVDDMVAEGDKVVVRQTWTGTHTGADFMGIPAAGKKVSMGVIDIIRIEGGKFAEHWGQMDLMAMMHQLGAIPPPGQS